MVAMAMILIFSSERLLKIDLIVIWLSFVWNREHSVSRLMCIEMLCIVYRLFFVMFQLKFLFFSYLFLAEINEYIIYVYNFGSVLIYGYISIFLCLVKTFKRVEVHYWVNYYMLNSLKS